ncbi:uncharacterized protein WCC33_000050 [Rhinophrynus dorsalis]
MTLKPWLSEEWKLNGRCSSHGQSLLPHLSFHQVLLWKVTPWQQPPNEGPASTPRSNNQSYREWTIPKITAELHCRHIPFSASARKPELFRLLPPTQVNIPEFVLAFSIFRDILCSSFPSRRQELDQYLYTLVDLGYRYG